MRSKKIPYLLNLLDLVALAFKMLTSSPSTNSKQQE